MSQFQSYEQFKKADRKLRGELAVSTKVFLSHVVQAVDFFHTEGNHNIQIINDVLDTASTARFPRNKICDWLKPLVGHKVVRDSETRRFEFGGKDADTRYDEIVEHAPEHFAKYPSWEEFSPESAPKAFEPEKLYSREIKRLMRQAEEMDEHGYGVAAEGLRAAANAMKAQQKVDGIFASSESEQEEATAAPAEHAVA